MRLYVAGVMYLCILELLNVLLEAGIIRRGRIPKSILGWLDKMKRYLRVWGERVMAGGSEELPAGD